MASVVSICNLALSHLGDRATLTSIDPPEGSAQADHCEQFWPIARDEALSCADWRFASTTASLAQLDESLQTNPSWRFAYGLPADFLVARELVYTTGDMAAFHPDAPTYDLGSIDNGTVVLFANEELSALRYTRRVTDPTKYPAMLVTALSYLMAAYLAGPVIKGKTGAQTAMGMRQQWDMYHGKAATVDANQNTRRPAFQPSSVRARGYGGASTIHEDGIYRRSLPFWAQS